MSVVLQLFDMILNQILITLYLYFDSFVSYFCDLAGDHYGTIPAAINTGSIFC